MLNSFLSRLLLILATALPSAHALDQANWVVAPSGIPGATQATSVAYGNGYFVISLTGGANLANAVAWSSDGRTYTPANQVFSGGVKVTFFRGHFYAVAPGAIARSVDGRDWEYVTGENTLPSTGNLIATDRAMVANSANTLHPTVQTSSDGDTWTLRAMPLIPPETQAVGSALTAGGGYFWNAFRTGSGLLSRLARSADAENWTSVNLPWASAYNLDAAYGNGRLLLVSLSEIAISIDRGQTYRRIPQPAEARGTLRFAGGRFFSSQTLAWSLDGETWSPSFYADQHQSFRSIAYGSGRYVAVGGYAVLPNPGTDLVAIWQTPPPASIRVQPEDQIGALGRSAGFSFTLEAYPASPRFQWTRNGVPIPGATEQTLVIPDVGPADEGRYTCLITQFNLPIASESVQLQVVEASRMGRLSNLSVRSKSGRGDTTFVTGFVIGGAHTTGPTRLLVRGVGPSLQQFGVDDFLPDPRVEIHPAVGPTTVHDNWGARRLWPQSLGDWVPSLSTKPVHSMLPRCRTDYPPGTIPCTP